MPKDEQRSMMIDNDNGVPIISSYEPLISPLMTYFFFNKVPVWTDLLPGCYNLICRMRLRRHVRELFCHRSFQCQIRSKLRKLFF